MYPPPPTGTPVLQILTLNPSTIAENSLAGVVVGSIAGKTAASVLTLANDAGGRFAVSGGNQIVAGATSTDYETATSHNIDVLETLAGATGNPKTTTITINVTDVNESAGLSSTAAAQTSVAGTAPYTFTVTMGSDIYSGFYLDIERSATGATNGDGTYTVTTLSMAHQLTIQERADDFITTQALSDDGYVQPASGSTFYEHYRWRREDGTVGPWYQLSDSINASTATLTPGTGTSKSSFLTVTNSNLTFTGTGGVGAYQGDRATAATSGTTIQFEVTIGTVVGSSWFLIGLEDGTSNLNSGFPGPGYTNSAGIAIRMHPDEVKVFWNAQANSLQFLTTAGMVAAGDVYTFRFDLTNHTLDVWRTRVGVNGGLPQKIGPQCTGLPTLSAYYLFVAPLVEQSGTVNFGGQTFSKALDSGYTIYG